MHSASKKFRKTARHLYECRIVWEILLKTKQMLPCLLCEALQKWDKRILKIVLHYDQHTSFDIQMGMGIWIWRERKTVALTKSQENVDAVFIWVQTIAMLLVIMLMRTTATGTKNILRQIMKWTALVVNLLKRFLIRDFLSYSHGHPHIYHAQRGSSQVWELHATTTTTKPGKKLQPNDAKCRSSKNQKNQE